MMHLRFSKPLRTALTVSLVSLLTVVPLAIAQQRVRFTPPTPPDPKEPTDRGRGGGRRGPCDAKYQGLTALVPLPRPNFPDDRWGLTVSDRPTVWFDVPTGIDAPVLAEWRLRNATGQTLTKTIFRIPKTKAGVIGLQIPIKAPLAIGTYQWDLALYCDNSSDRRNDEFDIPAVRKGRIQRISTPQALQQELATTKTPLDHANLYAKYGIWYDSLTTLGMQMQTPKTTDKNIVNTWRELLQQQKLETGSSVTVTSCCGLKKP
jgi:hypothetical protein